MFSPGKSTESQEQVSGAQRSFQEKSVKIRTSTVQHNVSKIDLVPEATGESERNSICTNPFSQWKPQIAESIEEVTEL